MERSIVTREDAAGTHEDRDFDIFTAGLDLARQKDKPSGEGRSWNRLRLKPTCSITKCRKISMQIISVTYGDRRSMYSFFTR